MITGNFGKPILVLLAVNHMHIVEVNKNRFLYWFKDHSNNLGNVLCRIMWQGYTCNILMDIKTMNIISTHLKKMIKWSAILISAVVKRIYEFTGFSVIYWNISCVYSILLFGLENPWAQNYICSWLL